MYIHIVSVSNHAVYIYAGKEIFLGLLVICSEGGENNFSIRRRMFMRAV